MAIRTKHAGPCPKHIGEAKRAEKMRKVIPAARNLPLQIVDHSVSVAGENQQIILACKVTCKGLGDLCGVGKVNEPVGQIDRRPEGFARLVQSLPFFAA